MMQQHTIVVIILYNSIVKSFETITDALLDQENATSVTFIEQNIAFSGRRVSSIL